MKIFSSYFIDIKLYSSSSNKYSDPWSYSRYTRLHHYLLQTRVSSHITRVSSLFPKKIFSFTSHRCLLLVPLISQRYHNIISITKRGLISRRRFKANSRRPTSAVQSASNAGANINLGAKHGSFSKMVKRGWMEDRSISRFVASSRRRVPRVLHFSTDQEPDVYYVAARSSMQYIYMRFCSTCTLLCSPVFAIERMAKLQCWSIPFDRCCIYTRFNACSCEISIGPVLCISFFTSIVGRRREIMG